MKPVHYIATKDIYIQMIIPAMFVQTIALKKLFFFYLKISHEKKQSNLDFPAKVEQE